MRLETIETANKLIEAIAKAERHFREVNIELTNLVHTGETDAWLTFQQKGPNGVDSVVLKNEYLPELMKPQRLLDKYAAKIQEHIHYLKKELADLKDE